MSDHNPSAPDTTRLLRRRVGATLGTLAGGLVAIGVTGILAPTALMLVTGLLLAAGGLVLGASQLIERAETGALERRVRDAAERGRALGTQAAEQSLARGGHFSGEAVTIGARAEAAYEAMGSTGDGMDPGALLRAFGASAFARSGDSDDQELHARILIAVESIDSTARCATAWMN
jgi:hypothetical protein